MISDFVKGKKQFDYPPMIQKGIRLHREIDRFTDEHPCTASIKELFRPQYRLYAGAFTDVVYDHFLANDENEFKDEAALKTFTAVTYGSLASLQQWFPERFSMMFPYMQKQDWLFNYRFAWGIEKSFGGLVRRAAYLAESEIAFHIFSENTNQIRQQYQVFFPELRSFTVHTLNEILKD